MIAERKPAPVDHRSGRGWPRSSLIQAVARPIYRNSPAIAKFSQLGAGFPPTSPKRKQSPGSTPLPPRAGVLFRRAGMLRTTKCFAYHVNQHRVALAAYELQGAYDFVAVSEARSPFGRFLSVARNLAGRALCCAT